jgi:hypothetical protein
LDRFPDGQPAYPEPPSEYATAAQPAPQWDMIQHIKDLAELKDEGILPEDGKRERPGQAYLASRPISCTRWTAWPREETPSLR